MKANRKTKVPNQWFVFDTETVEECLPDGSRRHHLRLGVVLHYRYRTELKKAEHTYAVFHTPEEFWHFVFGKIYRKASFYVFAHNLDFDAAIVRMWSTMAAGGWRLRSFCNKYKAYFWNWRKGDMSLKFVCTLNLFPGSIQEIGRSVGLNKLTVDFNQVDDDVLTDYCRRDVDILHAAVLRWVNFIKENNLGCFKSTLAGQAFTAFKHRFMNVPIYVHGDEEVMRLERAAYFGGRVECFYLGKVEGKTLHALDVVSMYPSVMMENLYPVKMVEHGKNALPEYLRSALRRRLAVARVRLRTEKPYFPCYARDKLVFPVGEFEAIMTTPELKMAFECAEVLSVEEYALYEGGKIFTPYVEFFFRERQKAKEAGDTLSSYFYKLMLNSLYGKFGQKTPKWKKIGEYEPGSLPDAYIEVRHGDRWGFQRRFAGIVEESFEETDAYDAFVAVAAHVTAYARVKLLHFIRVAGWENTYYVDTDCLHVNATGHRRLQRYIKPGRLGMLEEQASTRQAQYYGLKDYVFGEKTKLKGIRKDAVLVDHNLYEQDMWLRFPSRCAAGDIEDFRVVRVKKRLSREYGKGKTEEKGGRVSPFRLPDGEALLWQYTQDAGTAFEREARVLKAEERRAFRRAVLSLGGVNDRDYESLPRWCIRRKTGHTLDELSVSLREEGWPVEDANSLYSLIWEM